MVQILPPKTSLGNAFGQAVGSGLSSGIQQGSQIGFQRGMLQDALKGLENLPKNATPFQLASQLMQATAGIPGAERYVGQLYPLLLGQLRSQQAFGEPGQTQGQTYESTAQPGMQGQFPSGTQQPGAQGEFPYGQTAQSLTPGANVPPGGPSGGILGSLIPQDQINQQAQQYAQQTGTGIEGATQMQQYLLGKNAISLQQRQMAEQKAQDLGVKPDEIPAFMQLGQRHQNAKTLDDWARATDRDYKEYKNLSKSLESASYPGFWTGLLTTAGKVSGLPVGGFRETQLKRIDNTVNRLVNMGFEPQVREKLSSAGLSPAEVEERLHPFSPQTKTELSKLPSYGPPLQSEESLKGKEEKVKDFLQKNVTNNTSLLALRNKLWEKGYQWEKIAKMMNEAIDPRTLTAAQTNELGILEREPPRQSLNYIFHGEFGNIFKTLRGQK